MTLADRQSASSRQGAEFEAMVETWAKIRGHQVVARHWRHPLVLVEIDLVLATVAHGEVWVECAGSWESNRNGLQRTDTMAKKIGSAAVLGTLTDRRPYWLVTSHLPRPGSAPDAWLRAVRSTFDQVISLGEGGGDE
jgi:hypothetical protein